MSAQTKPVAPLPTTVDADRADDFLAVLHGAATFAWQGAGPWVRRDAATNGWRFGRHANENLHTAHPVFAANFLGLPEDGLGVPE